jgi:dTDP-4-dehydrorhamnose reductase
MKVLILGSNGQLGSELKKIKSENDDWVFTDLKEIDIVSGKGFENYTDISWVINCAAYTAVDKAETDVDMCRAINESSLNTIIEFCTKQNAKLTHVSTDFVFDGENGAAYKEDDQANPLSVYGRTKRNAEFILENSTIDYWTFRTSWLYNKEGKNFVNTMKALGESRDELTIIGDQLGTPTYAKDLALLIVDLIDANIDIIKGTYHFSNEGAASWYDFAYEIISLLDIDCNVKSIPTENYPTPAERPKNSIMSKEKLKSRVGDQPYIRHWKTALKDCLDL